MHVLFKLSDAATEEGMNFLRRAQVMYMRRPQSVRDAFEERCENNYTMTMPLDCPQIQDTAQFVRLMMLRSFALASLQGSIWLRPMERYKSPRSLHASVRRP